MERVVAEKVQLGFPERKIAQAQAQVDELRQVSVYNCSINRTLYTSNYNDWTVTVTDGRNEIEQDAGHRHKNYRWTSHTERKTNQKIENTVTFGQNKNVVHGGLKYKRFFVILDLNQLEIKFILLEIWSSFATKQIVEKMEVDIARFVQILHFHFFKFRLLSNYRNNYGELSVFLRQQSYKKMHS